MNQVLNSDSFPEEETGEKSGKDVSVGWSMFGPALLFLFLALLRMVVLVEPALVDPSEGRFASAALQMLQSGDWITPKIHDYGNGWIPYLAKPPFHMWLVASSLWLFGVNEFAARFPSFLALVGTGGVLFWLTRSLYGKNQAVIVSAIFSSTLGLWLFAPVCLTDASLMFCVTLALASLTLVWSGDLRRWVGYLFFVAVALGLMVKGPVALVFIGLPVVFAVVWRREISWALKLPWIGGVLLVLACTLPWYLECEARNPGFLRYFIVEEHIQRFLKPHTEVRYGAVHTEPRGTILLYAFGVLLPWSLFLLIGLFKRGLRQGVLKSFNRNGVEALMLCWALAPIVFFVFARSILPTYVFPTVPAWALCLGLIFTRIKGWNDLISQGKLLPRIGVFFVGVAVILFSIMSWRFGLDVLYLVGLSLVLLILWGNFRLIKDSQHAPLLKFMITAMGAISIAVLGLGKGVTLNRSTRAPIEQLQMESPKARSPIVILFHDPRSIHFYVAKIMKNRPQVFSGNSVEALKKWRSARVMVKTSDQKRLEGLDLTGLALDRCIGSWCMYRWKRPK
jgi:4-amino-4-deoxy-L-arabinose transferase-like glycosyltransferase